MDKLTGLFATWGLTRDSRHWFWLKIASLAGVILGFGWDGGALLKAGAYLGIPLTVVQSHWVVAAAFVLLWLAGSMDASDLPGAKK
jgi:hypothetical protein